jgi:pentatricopeptide repeat protein
MRQVQMQPNAVVINAAVSACEKCRQWGCALDLLQQAHAEGIELDVITYSLVKIHFFNGDAHTVA